MGRPDRRDRGDARRGRAPGDVARGTYDGVLRADGAAITGTWTPSAGRGVAAPQPLTFARPTAVTAWRDSSAHRVRFVAVGPDVRLEVLDWGGPARGGAGRPLVLLAGAGNNAHVFDAFAPTLAARYHVYGITRRGFAPSSIAASVTSPTASLTTCSPCWTRSALRGRNARCS